MDRRFVTGCLLSLVWIPYSCSLAFAAAQSAPPRQLGNREPNGITTTSGELAPAGVTHDSQDVPRDSTTRKLEGIEGHHEKEHDPPADAGVIAAQLTSPAAVITRGRFTSYQVNVNAQGNNIIGDASNEPSLAVDPTNPNIMAIGWRHFDTIASNFRQAGIAYTTDGGLNWTFPDVLDRGQFRSDPVLRSDRGGIFYYSSLSTLESIEVFRSFDGGVTWGIPVPAFGGDKQWIAVDRTLGSGSGHLYQIWNVQFSCCEPNDFTRSIDVAQSFQGPFAVEPTSMKWGTMDVGPDGTLFLGGATLSQSAHLVGRSSNAREPLQVPTFDFVKTVELGGVTAFASGPNPAGLLGQVSIAVNQSQGPSRGHVYLLASVNPPGADPLDIMFSRSEDAGQTWSTPVRVNDDDPQNEAWQWFGTMSVSPNGRIDVVWNDTRNTGVVNLSETFYAYSRDGGRSWTKSVPINPVFNSHHGWPQQNKLGDYYDMNSDNTGANLAYAATFNDGLGGQTEQDVYFVRLEADCNDNGIPDDEDIAGPDVEDCDNNGIPDDCQEDCNKNGIADACEIADGTGFDCNENRILDECETTFDCTQIRITEDGPPCLEVEITLPGENEHGDITLIGPSVPAQITFEFLNTSCQPGGLIEVFLNDTSLASTDPDPTNACDCAAAVRSIVIDDAVLIESVWNTGGTNILRFVLTGPDEDLAWVRALLQTGADAKTVCLFDPSFGMCMNTSLCSHATVGAPLDESALATFERELVSVAYANSILPETIDIENLPDGDYEFCISSTSQLTAQPESITFEALNTSCDPGGVFEFFLNGISVGTVDADPTDGCTCNALVQAFSVTDPSLLSNWVLGGTNTLRATMTGGSENLAWIRAQISDGVTSFTSCIFATGIGCTDLSLCAHSFVSSPIDATIEAMFSTLVACRDFEKFGERLVSLNTDCPIISFETCRIGEWDGYDGLYADVWAEGNFAYIPNWGNDGNAARVHIIDISNPILPVLANTFMIPPPNDFASPQDVKVSNGLLYIALEADSNDGVAIVDVRDPLSPVLLTMVTVPGFNSPHNIFVDKGYLYVIDGTSIAIVDLTTFNPDSPPANPITTAKWVLNDVGQAVVHDITVKNGRLYAAAWDSLQIFDVTSIATEAPTFLGSTPGSNTHSCWPTDDGQFVVTGEERPDGGITVFRITDNGGSVTLTQTDSLTLEGAFSVHNQVVIGNRLFNSWYERGLQVFDIDPDTGRLHFLAEFDTSGSGFGNWGVYPFLGEDRILLSDMEEGLLIVSLLMEGEPCACPDSTPAVAETIAPGGGPAVPNIKMRVLSFSAGDRQRSQAIRVTLVDLPAPFDIFNTTGLWVTALQSICENSGRFDCPPPDFERSSFWTATLGCDPVYRDWSDTNPLHISHPLIVPGATYAVEVIDEGCDLAANIGFSQSLLMVTSIWGDLVENCSVLPCGPPDGSVDIVTDVSAIIDKFRNLPGAPSKTRCDLEPAVLDWLINISDATFALDAFVAKPFPFNEIPEQCP